jgi:hypothetical protein
VIRDFGRALVIVLEALLLIAQIDSLDEEVPPGRQNFYTGAIL